MFLIANSTQLQEPRQLITSPSPQAPPHKHTRPSPTFLSPSFGLLLMVWHFSSCVAFILRSIRSVGTLLGPCRISPCTCFSLLLSLLPHPWGALPAYSKVGSWRLGLYGRREQDGPCRVISRVRNLRQDLTAFVPAVSLSLPVSIPRRSCRIFVAPSPNFAPSRSM